MRIITIMILAIIFVSCEKQEQEIISGYDISDKTDSLGVPYYIVYFANSFSPNGDGINDHFGVIGHGYGNGSLFEVFDRSQNRVYYSNDPYKPWNGKLSGIACPEDIYAYRFSFTDPDGILHSYKGAVHLLR